MTATQYEIERNNAIAECGRNLRQEIADHGFLANEFGRAVARAIDDHAFSLEHRAQFGAPGHSSWLKLNAAEWRKLGAGLAPANSAGAGETQLRLALMQAVENAIVSGLSPERVQKIASTII